MEFNSRVEKKKRKNNIFDVYEYGENSGNVQLHEQ